MKVSSTLAALALFATNATAYNFWVMEALMGEGCAPGSSGCGSGSDLLFVTQNSKTPGCVEFDNARITSPGSFPPHSFFNGNACGVEVNFYEQSDGSWIYYKKNGDGKQLGKCVRNKQSSKFCLSSSGMGSTAVVGQWGCTNFSQVKNGINPCVY
ncbi:hypothetical protein BGZ63DRAFT_425231 [Mariannaea sp. PMI_226]|nr:hypothetical protein BGZ63DRAFT_425231 [Mariannaea sp. PMI_226]